MNAWAAAVAYVLLGAAAAFQGALALGAPWGRCAYGGRTTTATGRLSTPFRAASGGTVLALGAAAYAVHDDLTLALWICAGLFTLNTAGNLAGTHPVERWGMSAVTLTLAGTFLTMALT